MKLSGNGELPRPCAFDRPHSIHRTAPCRIRLRRSRPGRPSTHKKTPALVAPGSLEADKDVGGCGFRPGKYGRPFCESQASGRQLLRSTHRGVTYHCQLRFLLVATANLIRSVSSKKFTCGFLFSSALAHLIGHFLATRVRLLLQPPPVQRVGTSEQAFGRR